MQLVKFAPEHVSAAAEIEKLCFSDPWSEASLMMLAEGGYGTGIACIEDGVLVAYVGMVSVLDEGEINGIGTHNELLNSCEIYKEISESQMGGAFLE